ncbi:MAG: hypothetical protein A4E73_00049 [Syntrophaceae bacterium PtaU1.Bin231]|nr:MAG: hypothetical protein A4E73_00049 [Syntrophaceae bacterium PtaU1.Bin231]
MQSISFPFGEHFLDLNLEQEADVLLPEMIPAAPDALAAARRALAQPIGCERLSVLARGRTSVAVVINDITRPAPTELLLTALVEELAEAGVGTDRITAIVATGNHEPPTEADLLKMMGRWRSRLRVISHDCQDQDMLTYVGTTNRGLPVHVNRHYAEASLKILTGIVAPHQSAGFGGGRKSVVPGIAGLTTLKAHHSYPIRPSGPVLGIIRGNAFHEEAVAAARLAGADFIVNAVKNYRGEIVEVVAGELEKAHLHGVGICEKAWVRRVPKACDVAFVSPGRYPKDIDLHQAQKGLVVAEQVTRPGGTIVLIAECRNGIGKFGKVLKEARSVDQVIEDFNRQGFSADNSSKAYLFARCCKDHRVFVVSSGLDPAELAQMFMTGFRSLPEAAERALAPYDRPSILCIPYAGDVIPILDDRGTAR